MREHIALLLQLSVRTQQTDEFVALGRRQVGIGRCRLGPLEAPAAVSLSAPVLDSPAVWFELAGEVGQIAAGADQLDHLATELAGHAGRVLGIRQYFTRKHSQCPPNQGNPGFCPLG